MNIRGIWSMAIGALLLFSGLFLASVVVMLFGIVSLAVGTYILTRRRGVPRSKLVYSDLTPVNNTPQDTVQQAGSKFCYSCGTKLSTDALYCSKCGSIQQARG